MRSTWQQRLKEEAGYTLVETLVAMALFLSVLIPLGVSIGMLLLDREAEKTNRALLIAESEMTSAGLEEDLQTKQFDVSGGFIIRREVIVNSYTRDVQIVVSHQKKPGKVLVKLHKTLVQAP